MTSRTAEERGALQSISSLLFPNFPLLGAEEMCKGPLEGGPTGWGCGDGARLAWRAGALNKGLLLGQRGMGESYPQPWAKVAFSPLSW